MGDNVITNFKDLIVYKKAFEQALKIFNLTKAFPKDEQYSLTDQIRRSSRSICTNIGEAWRKRRYSAHFVSKLTDSDAEASETMIWLDFALQCGYISSTVHSELASELVSEYEQIGKMLGAMIAAPTKFCYNDKK
jgi:four helix bundle protein